MIAFVVTIVVESSYSDPAHRIRTNPASANSLLTAPTSTLTHAPTRSSRRRRSLGGRADPPDVALPGRQPPELLGHRLPPAAEHAAEHVDTADAHDRSPAGTVAAAPPGRGRPTRPPACTARPHSTVPRRRRALVRPAHVPTRAWPAQQFRSQPWWTQKPRIARRTWNGPTNPRVRPASVPTCGVGAATCCSCSW